MFANCKKDYWVEDVCIFSSGDVVEIDNENRSLVNCRTHVSLGNIPKEDFNNLINTKLDIINSIEEEFATERDNVDHPSHYTQHPSGIECIEITRHYCFSIGNAIKYLWRAGLKKDASMDDKMKEIEDLRKAIWYINDRIAQLEGPKKSDDIDGNV